MSDDNIAQFPTKPEDEWLIGPFEVWRVLVEGRTIPRLTGHKDGDGIALIVDGRFSVTFPKDLAQSAAWLLANALAVGEGYPFLGSTSKDRPFAPQTMQLGDIP